MEDIEQKAREYAEAIRKSDMMDFTFAEVDYTAGFKAGKQERDRETLEWLKEVHKDYEHFGHEQHAAAIEYVIRKLEIENLSK